MASSESRRDGRVRGRGAGSARADQRHRGQTGQQQTEGGHTGWQGHTCHRGQHRQRQGGGGAQSPQRQGRSRDRGQRLGRQQKKRQRLEDEVVDVHVGGDDQRHAGQQGQG